MKCRLPWSSCGFDFNFIEDFLFFPPLQLFLSFFHLGCTKRSYDQPYRGGSSTSGTIGAAPKVFTVSSLMAKHREKKSIKEMGPNHHSQLLRLPSVPLGREPSFFFFLESNGNGIFDRSQQSAPSTPPHHCLSPSG